MSTEPDPRLGRAVRELEKIRQMLDDLQADVVAVMRDHGTTWEEIGECFEPPKSRQAIAKWMATRRARRQR